MAHIVVEDNELGAIAAPAFAPSSASSSPVRSRVRVKSRVDGMGFPNSTTRGLAALRVAAAHAGTAPRGMPHGTPTGREPPVLSPPKRRPTPSTTSGRWKVRRHRRPPVAAAGRAGWRFVRPDQPLLRDRGHQRGDLFLHPSDAELGWRPAVGDRVSFLLGVHNGRPAAYVWDGSSSDSEPRRPGRRRTRTTPSSRTGLSVIALYQSMGRPRPLIPVTLVRVQSSHWSSVCMITSRRWRAPATETRSRKVLETRDPSRLHINQLSNIFSPVDVSGKPALRRGARLPRRCRGCHVDRRRHCPETRGRGNLLNRPAARNGNCPFARHQLMATCVATRRASSARRRVLSTAGRCCWLKKLSASFSRPLGGLANEYLPESSPNPSGEYAGHFHAEVVARLLQTIRVREWHAGEYWI